MKVLLVSFNREHVPDPVFPLGLSYIAAAVRQCGHETNVLDLCFSDNVDNAVKHSITNFNPDIIGISLRNIDDVAYPKKHSYLQEYKQTITLIRKYTRASIVLGGSGFTIMPEHFMKELKADFGIIGEGEKAFPELIENIKCGFKNRTHLIFSSRLKPKNINNIIPERDLFDCESYYKFGGMLNIQTKRGCPFKCIYCTYPNIEGEKLRMRSPSSVADEIEDILIKTGIHHFFIVDSIFNYPVSHAKAVCTEIIKRCLYIKWSCYANPAYMTEELAEKMARAGCTGIEFGTDSLIDRTLSILGKNFTFSDIKNASRICRSHGIKFCHFIFVGVPEDNPDTVKSNISRLDKINPDAAVIMAGIRIFPNTRLAEIARKDLGITDTGLKPVFYLSRNIGNIDSIAEIISKRRNWIMPGYEINIFPKLQKKLRERGIKGPLWEELSKR